MDIERAAKQVQSVTGLIGILGGLLAAIAAFDRQLREAVDVLGSLGFVGLVGLAAVLILVGVAMLASGRRKVSRLIDPDALRLESRNPEHLIGRAEDVRLLCEKCEARPLVFLVGESGSGKTSLIQAGLVPEMAKEGRLIPVILDMADLDWEKGPLTALADRFWRALSPEERAALGVEKPPAREDLTSLLAGCYPSLGRTPLIILDQIDDYQLRHRARFLPERARSWLGVKELLAGNKFWSTLADLLAARSLHVLLVTRSDNADGLESLRLAPDPLVVRLDPLPAGFTLRVMDQLTHRPAGEPQVIEAPERGWNRLRTRLADDLERSGSVLPQQLKLALLGLARLRPLAVVGYERSGGIEGLEARYIEDALARAAERGGLPAADLRSVVMRLVEREGPRRAQPLSTADLARCLSDRDATALATALESLEEAEILRRREADGTAAWQLDHDYLARGILRVEANADRWKSMLASRAREFEDSRGSRRARWRAMLSLREQVALLCARLVGRFRYGEHRGYALRSAAPYAAMAGVLAVLVAASNIAIEVFRAEGVWTVIMPGELMSPVEYTYLGELAESGSVARGAFAHRLFDNPQYAARAEVKPEPIVRAFVGLDEDWAATLVDWFVTPALEGDDVPAIRAAAAVVSQFPEKSWRRLPPPFPEVLEEAWAEGRPLDEAVMFALAEGERLSDTARRNAAEALDRLKANRGATGAAADFERSYAAGVYVSSSRGLPPDRLSDALATIRADLRANRQRPPAIGSLARAYAWLARRLPPEPRAQAIMDLIEEMRVHRGDASVIQMLALAVQFAARTLPDDNGMQCARPLLQEMEAARGDPTSVIPIAMAFAATVPVSASEREEAATLVRQEIEASHGGGALVGWLAEAHAALTLARPDDALARADALGAVLDALSVAWARDDRLTDAKRREGPSLRVFLEACGFNDCFALFAGAVLDTAVALPFHSRAALVTELLKVPASTRLRLTEALLARMRSDTGAEAAGLPGGGLWGFVAWAKDRGLEPGRPLDPDRLFDVLPP